MQNTLVLVAWFLLPAFQCTGQQNGSSESGKKFEYEIGFEMGTECRIIPEAMCSIRFGDDVGIRANAWHETSLASLTFEGLYAGPKLSIRYGAGIGSLPGGILGVTLENGVAFKTKEIEFSNEEIYMLSFSRYDLYQEEAELSCAVSKTVSIGAMARGIAFIQRQNSEGYALPESKVILGPSIGIEFPGKLLCCMTVKFGADVLGSGEAEIGAAFKCSLSGRKRKKGAW